MNIMFNHTLGNSMVCTLIMEVFEVDWDRKITVLSELGLLFVELLLEAFLGSQQAISKQSQYFHHNFLYRCSIEVIQSALKI